MSDHIYLIGAEQVEQASHEMTRAARDMQNAVSNLEHVLSTQHQWMDDWLFRLEEILTQKQIIKYPKNDEFGRMSYKIWSEGYAATGERAGAQCHGTFSALDFREAVSLWKKTLDVHSASLVDVETLTFWGCHLFDNEKEARKSFG